MSSPTARPRFGAGIRALEHALSIGDMQAMRSQLAQTAVTGELIHRLEQVLLRAIEQDHGDVALTFLNHAQPSNRDSTQPVFNHERLLSAAIRQNNLPLMNGAIRAAGGISVFCEQDCDEDKPYPPGAAVLAACNAWRQLDKDPLRLLTAWRICLALGNETPDDEALRTAYRGAKGLLNDLFDPTARLRITKSLMIATEPNIFSVCFRSDNSISDNDTIEQSYIEAACDEDPTALYRTQSSHYTYIEASLGSRYDDSDYNAYSAGVLYFSNNRTSLATFITSQTPLSERIKVLEFIQKNDHEALRQLLSNGVPADEYMNFYGSRWRPIHYACDEHKAQAIQVLHEHNVRLSRHPMDPAPPLICAIQSIHWSSEDRKENDEIRVIYRMIELGAPVDDVDADGQTALMLACQHDFTSAANALLALGANPALKDSKGKTARDHCMKNGRSNECMELIDAHIAGRALDKPIDPSVLKPLTP